VTDIFVLDATSASTIASVEGYDALTAGGRKVVVTQQVLAEIRDPKTPQIYKDRFNAWYGANLGYGASAFNNFSTARSLLARCQPAKKTTRCI
jgi:hypothetical protein